MEHENEENLDLRWRENPLFAVQNSLPSINHTVMFELIKSMGFFSIYVDLLQCFHLDRQCKELERLVKHITFETTAADVKFLLEVWWEMMKGRREVEDNCDKFFADKCVYFIQRPSESLSQASKRFKPDPDIASSSMCMLCILFQALKDIKENINSSELCFFAISNCLDIIYTRFLLDHPVYFPVEVKLQTIAQAVSLRKINNRLEGVELTQAILESQRDLAATLSPAEAKSSGMTLDQAMQIALEILCAWNSKGLLKIPNNGHSAALIRLKDSLCRVLKSTKLSNTFENKSTLNCFIKTLEALHMSLSFTVPECPTSDIANVAMAIMDGNLTGFQDLPKYFASVLSHMFQDTEWLSCIERNKNKFQQKDIVMALVASLVTKCQRNESVNHCKKLKDITVDIFSQLPLPEKNAAIADVLAMSNKGLHGFLNSAVIAGFNEELNLAFNCIIQSDTKSSLSSAVFSVAGVAFQNPEATMRRCCHMAIVDLKAHTLIAQILQQLSGLSSSFKYCTGDNMVKEQDLLCRCLHDTVWNKLSSPQEEEQFLIFLTTLMDPVIYGQNGDVQSFLPPEKAVCAFILPYLSSLSPKACRLELCLQLLQSALAPTTFDVGSQWIMNCSPFALLYCLAQLLNNCSRCWEQPLESEILLALESKELLKSVLASLGTIVGQEVALAPGTWSRAISWLYEKVKELDWTVRFHLKVVWGEHFKFEVPESLMAVCDLSEQEWSSLIQPQYGQGTGLLAWLECCCLSDYIQDTMLRSLSLNLNNPEDVNMFSKGLLVAVTQILPWCTCREWVRLLNVLDELLQSDKLYVPYSVEYVDYLPLLDLYSFAGELRMSVFLLRIFQLLCGCSCADWLPLRAWSHVGKLYATAVQRIISSLKDKIPLKSTTASGTHSQEILFVMTQLYCHVVHVQVMMPGQPEPLFLCALDILSQYDAVLAAYPKSSTALQTANTKHFFTTITDNLQCKDMKHVLHQKIAGL